MYTYKITYDDLLKLMTYDYTTNPKKARSLIPYVPFIFLIIFGVLAYYEKALTLLGFLIFVGVTYFIRVFVLQKSYYKRIFSKSITNNYARRINNTVQFEIKDDHLHFEDKAGDSNFMFAAIVLITELQTHFLIRFNNEHVVFIPKISKKLERDIKDMIAGHKLPYKAHLEWKYQP